LALADFIMMECTNIYYWLLETQQHSLLLRLNYDFTTTNGLPFSAVKRREWSPTGRFISTLKPSQQSSGTFTISLPDSHSGKDRGTLSPLRLITTPTEFTWLGRTHFKKLIW